MGLALARPGRLRRYGDMDLYLGAAGCVGTCPSYPKSLYVQNPDGSSTDVGRRLGRD